MEEKTTPVERNMDRRLVERNLRKGIISHADIEAYEGTLKDVSDNLEVVSIDADDEQDAQAAQINGAGTATQQSAAEQSAIVTNIASSQGGV